MPSRSSSAAKRRSPVPALDPAASSYARGRTEAKAIVRSGKRFLVTCHVRPDADALGSALGFAWILRAIGKEAVVLAEGGVPPMLRFLDGHQEVVDVPPPGEFDATFIMDAAAVALVPRLPPIELSGPRIIVDHHAGHDGYGDIVVRDIRAVATAEVVLQLAEDLGVEDIPVPSAQPLYAALCADTGGFRYTGTSAATHRLAARLLERGVDPWQVASHLFERWSPERMKLLAEVLATMKVEGPLVVVPIDSAMMARSGATDDMVEGMVNYGRMLNDTEISALLWIPKGTTSVKVSLRSAGRADVARVAAALGGGGHRNAAGATIAADLTEAERRLVEEAKRELARLDSEG